MGYEWSTSVWALFNLKCYLLTNLRDWYDARGVLRGQIVRIFPMERCLNVLDTSWFENDPSHIVALYHLVNNLNI